MLIVLLILCSSLASAELMTEGESSFRDVDGERSTLKLLVVSDIREVAIFSWKGELSKSLKEREKHRFSDGSLLVVGDILIDEAQDNRDMVDVYFGVASPNAFRTPTNHRISGFAVQEAIDNLFDTLFETESPQTQNHRLKPNNNLNHRINALK